MDHESLRKKMHALEKMRTVETRITEGSLPLIDRILHDFSEGLQRPDSGPVLNELKKGELWWQDLDLSFGENDPRCFPVVRGVLAKLQPGLDADHFDHCPSFEGRSYTDLVTPIREQVLLRMQLRQIAGTS